MTRELHDEIVTRLRALGVAHVCQMDHGEERRDMNEERVQAVIDNLLGNAREYVLAHKDDSYANGYVDALLGVLKGLRLPPFNEERGEKEK